MKTVYLSKKQSGNYIVAGYTDPAWKTLALCVTPAELLKEVRKLTPLDHFCKVIKSEYNRAQLTCKPSGYTQKDALRAFGLQVNKENIEKYFAL